MSGLLLSMSAKPPVALQKTSLTMSPRWQTAGNNPSDSSLERDLQNLCGLQSVR
jgi:hypothetical protein